MEPSAGGISVTMLLRCLLCVSAVAVSWSTVLGRARSPKHTNVYYSHSRPSLFSYSRGYVQTRPSYWHFKNYAGRAPGAGYLHYLHYHLYMISISITAETTPIQPARPAVTVSNTRSRIILLKHEYKMD